MSGQGPPCILTSRRFAGRFCLLLLILADLNNGLDAAHRRILRQFDDKYAGIIGVVSSEMATGVISTREAVGKALQAFADQGITGFIDRGGHHWTLENYAEMAALTAIECSTIAGYVDTVQSYDYDLAIIDGHAGNCPICEAREDVIISVSGDDSRYSRYSGTEQILRMEIDAKKYLLSVDERYKIPSEETDLARQALQDYERRLEE